MFNVGNTVKVVGQQFSFMESIGYIGKVIKANGTGNRVYLLDNEYWYSNEELELMLSKDDLTTGMFVQRRCGDWELFIKEVPCSNARSDEKGLFIEVNDFHNTNGLYNLAYNLTSINNLEEFDIMKVAKVCYSDRTIQNILRDIIEGCHNPEDMNGFKIIWERKSEKEEQLNKLIVDLEKQLSDTKQELNKIKGEC